MVVSRCLECKEMIGGHDHRLLSTNSRISKADFDALLTCLQMSDDHVRRAAFESCLASVKREAVPDSKAISPDEFDVETLAPKQAIIFALPPSGAGADEPDEHAISQTEQPDAGAFEPRSAVLCFGDSLTAGLSRRGLPLRPYSARLEGQLAGPGGTALSIINAGVCGETTKDMCRRLRELLSQYDEAIAAVLILGGTNDLGDDDLTPGLTLGNLRQLHGMAHAAGALTGVLTLPECTEGSTDLVPQPYKDELDEINGALRDFASTSDSMFLVDVAVAFPQDQAHAALWEPDGVHLTAKGYEEMGDHLLEVVRLALRDR